MKKYWWILLTFVLLIVACFDREIKTKTTTSSAYLGLSDSAKYVGKLACIECHSDVWESYQHTGMGASYGSADTSKSVLVNRVARFYDAASNLHYENVWKNGELYIKEFRLHEKDTIHLLLKKIEDVIGSGHHTNSHIYHINGYYYQAPFTFYVQEDKADIPPGFENGFNSRFSRKIGLECMSCHNSYPEMEKGSQNKFKNVPEGINCERCHGPGSIHIAQKKQGKIVDIEKEIDYSIVNPSKLEMNLQFDICQRCHLQGNTILKEGKSFYDFKPGMHLEEVMTVFLPRYEGNEDFIMASHADRMQMSKCFIATKDKQSDDPIRPTKNQMTCITCHHPHESVKAKENSFFDAKCNQCHQEKKCKANEISNCVSCHMPKSSSIDIPHISITDHLIGVPKEKKNNNDRKFVELKAINNSSPTDREQLAAYLNQYEKFEPKREYIDRAEDLKNKLKEEKSAIHELVHLYSINKDYKALFALIAKEEIKLEMKLWKQKSWDNKVAWTFYRIGEAYLTTGIMDKAFLYFEKAVELAPFDLDFQNKLASIHLQQGNKAEAKKIWNWILSQNEEHVLALNNLAYIHLIEGDFVQAKIKGEKVISLDPDYKQGYLNLAQANISSNDIKAAIAVLEKWLLMHSKDAEVENLIKSLKQNEKTN